MKKEDSILFLGDVAPYRTYRFNPGCKTVINLECPITGNGVQSVGKIILGTGENHLPDTFNSSLLCVNLGNNHILDFGRVLELPFTPLDRFIRLPYKMPDDTYEIRFESHQKRRNFQRRFTEFIFHPHIPQKLKIKP